MLVPRGQLKSFPKRLRELREWRDLSQGGLAKLADIPASAISHFETGRRTPSLRSLTRLSRALDVTPDVLLGDPSSEEMTRHSDEVLLDRLQGLSDESRQIVDRIVALLFADEQREAARRRMRRRIAERRDRTTTTPSQKEVDPARLLEEGDPSGSDPN